MLFSVFPSPTDSSTGSQTSAPQCLLLRGMSFYLFNVTTEEAHIISLLDHAGLLYGAGLFIVNALLTWAEQVIWPSLTAMGLAMCGSSYKLGEHYCFARFLPSAHTIYPCTFLSYRTTQLTLSQRKTTQMPHPVTISNSLPGSLGADSTLHVRFECGFSWSPLTPSPPHSQCILMEQRQNNSHKHSHSERESMGDTP